MAGRPREFDREQALLKARNLFWRQGYEGTSMSDLVAELGIASARIYKAFGSKEQLFREAIASYETEEGGFADRAFAQESGIRPAIQRMLEDAVRLYSRTDLPQGCMVVSSAASVSAENDGLKPGWLSIGCSAPSRSSNGCGRRCKPANCRPAPTPTAWGTFSPSSCTACRFRRVTASLKRDCWRR